LETIGHGPGKENHGRKEGKYLTFSLSEEEYGIESTEYQDEDVEGAQTFGVKLNREYILFIEKMEGA
jgi:hypothetical protein